MVLVLVVQPEHAIAEPDDVHLVEEDGFVHPVREDGVVVSCRRACERSAMP